MKRPQKCTSEQGADGGSPIAPLCTIVHFFFFLDPTGIQEGCVHRLNGASSAPATWGERWVMLAMAAMATQLHPQEGVSGSGRDCAACAGLGIACRLRSCQFLPARLGMDGGECSGLLSEADGGDVVLLSLTSRHGFKRMRIRTRFS